ncbi:hypothetical protein G3M53_23315 [Streptomyces sp. SID7982]|nr:hypothetical protein [Streptomyces sp. SID7982]
MDVGSSFPADADADADAEAEAFEAVESGEAAIDDPAVGAQSGAVEGAAAGDGRDDAVLADLVAVDIVVVPAVGEE